MPDTVVRSLGLILGVASLVVASLAAPAPASGASTNRYYLSADTAKSAADKLLTGTRDVPGLAPGAVSAGSATVTIPKSTAAGTYFLLVCADDDAKATESDEGNNCGASGATVRVR